ncbi:MAG: hypothetical protein HFI75_08495 [Lachnospiraceae bacterium]|nr:hypothetical protein [Lachnospiraceae bacterium]
MDKYEYKLMAEEIVRLAGKKQYKTAAKMADQIRWEKVRNVQMLCTVSEIYEQVGKFEESKEVLLLAYNRSPNGKTIVYRLADLSVALKDYKEATDFYHEYIQMAPNDSNSLLLKYKIYRGKKAKIDTQIAILEEFKTRDYQEEWILELARLYHEAGYKEKCVEICNEIDLWFNEGTSVIQALELKKIYEPLTPMQEKKLQNKSEYMGESDKDKKNEEQNYAAKTEKTASQETKAETEKEQKKETRQKQLEKPAPLHPAAEAIIKMTKQKSRGEIKRGFSILPKEHTEPEEEEATESVEPELHLPEGIEVVELPGAAKKLKEAVASTEKKEEPAVSQAEEAVFEKASEVETSLWQPRENPVVKIQDTVRDNQSEETDILFELTEENRTEEDHSIEDQERDEEKPHGILGKMFSRLKMEDDELDEDFVDDYDENGPVSNMEQGMVTRGLTGQYEKIVIDDDDDDESDPLNTRMTAPIQVPEEDEEDEEEYEYVYEDEIEEEEYTDFDDEAEEGTGVSARSNKRFKLFRNTMEDDELFEEEEEYEPAQQAAAPLSYSAQYDTLNLQKELAKSIQQLMDATEKETVDSTLENVKKMVEESHIPKLSETMRFKAVRGNMLNNIARRQAEKLEQARDIEEVVLNSTKNAEEEMQAIPAEDASVLKVDSRPKPAAELAIKLKPAKDELTEPIEQMLTREPDGQLSILLPETAAAEEQIEGQLNMDGVLREWEKQELLSENDKDKRALEEARKRALEETQGIMSEIMGLLKDVIPKIGSIKDGEEKMSVLAQSLERVQKALPLTQGIVEAAEEGKEAASAIEAACAKAVIELAQMEEDGKEPEEKAAVSDIPKELESTAEEYAQEYDENAAAYDESDMESAEEAYENGYDRDDEGVYAEEYEEADESSYPDEYYVTDEEAYNEEYNENEDSLYDNEYHEMDDDLYGDDYDESYEEEYTEAPLAVSRKLEQTLQDDEELWEEEEVSAELMPELQKDGTEEEEAEDSYNEEEWVPKEKLSEEQRDILSYFLAIKSIAPSLEKIVKYMEYAPEHMIITGEEGSGKTSIAMRIIKAVQLNKDEKIESIAKIQAALLNQKKVTDILEKVNGGVLIIEKAGSLKPSTVYAIDDALYGNQYYVQIILVDRKEAIAKLLNVTQSFINDIRMRVDLPEYTNNELAEFAKAYAENNGYIFDGMALLALHSVIEIFQTDQHSANLEDVKNIMNEAMEHADKRAKKLFGKLFGKKNTDGIILLESDFE